MMSSWHHHNADTDFHHVCCQFMDERVEAAKYSSQAQVDIFCVIVHRSLSINVGRPTSHISRHVTAIGPRIILLSIGLSLLQSKYVVSNKPP